jgi:hypothetical protein
MALLTKFAIEGSGAKIFWRRIQAFRQQTLNERAEEPGIHTSTAQGELDSSRWVYKAFGLIPLLEEAGVSVEYSGFCG